MENIHNSNDASSSNNLQYTKLHLTLEWTIQNANKLFSNSKLSFIQSPDFKLSRNKENKFFFQLFPEGIDGKDCDNTSIYLYKCLPDWSRKFFNQNKCELSVINSKENNTFKAVSFFQANFV